MTTPQGPQPPNDAPSDPPPEQPAWGRPPAGGWGRPEQGQGPEDPDQTRVVPPQGQPGAPGQQSWDPDQTRVVPPQEQQGWGGQPPAGPQYGGQPQYGPPTQQYGAPPPQQYGAPPPQQYGAQPPQQYGTPPPQQYGQAPYADPRYGDQQQQWPGQQQWGQQGQQPTQQWTGQPQGAQQWGAGYPPLPEPSERSGRSARPFIIGGAIALVVLAAVAVLGFVTPGFFVTRVFDPAAVQQGVERVLTDDYGIVDVTSVTCASGVRVQSGAQFDCDATVDGEPVKVPIRVTSDAGDYQVGEPT